MIFRKEADIRNWWKKQQHGITPNGRNYRTFWIEARRGATFGLPDALVVCKGLACGVEMKLGTLRRDGSLNYEHRPAQKQCMRHWAGAGAPYVILVGLKDTDRLLGLAGTSGTQELSFYLEPIEHGPFIDLLYSSVGE